MDKISPFHFFKFLAWYEVETYTKDTPLRLKLIGEVINLIMWLCLKAVSGPLITHLACDQIDDVIYRHLLPRAVTSLSCTCMPYEEVEIPEEVYTPLWKPCVCKMSYTYEWAIRSYE